MEQREQIQTCLNRRQTESHQARLNGRGAKEEDEVNYAESRQRKNEV